MGHSVTQPTYEKKCLVPFAMLGRQKAPSANPLENCLHRCLKLDASGQDVFGSSSLPLKVFNTDPEDVLTLVKVII